MIEEFEKEICSNCKCSSCYSNIELIEQHDIETGIVTTIMRCLDYIPINTIRRKKDEDRNNTNQ